MKILMVVITMMMMVIMLMLMMMYISLVRVTPHYTTPACWRRLSMLSYCLSMVLSRTQGMYMGKCLCNCYLGMQ
jgi:hypothetical protein